MLSGEDNAGERWKTTIGLIRKKETSHVQKTFFVPLFCTTTTWNFMYLHSAELNVGSDREYIYFPIGMNAREPLWR